MLAALLVVIAVSFRPAVPVIWGDTPSFVESALRTLEAGRPTVAGGRDPGYPAFLAVTFAFGGGLGTVVRLQQAAWAVLILALAATAQAATRNAGGLVPIILVATYPGLLLFTHTIIASAMVAAIGNGIAFARGRDFAAWLGLVPKQMSTGDRTIFGRITKRGNRYLRTLFMQGARVILLRPKSWAKYSFGPWLTAAARRLHHNVLATALANKLARIAWTVLAQRRSCEARVEPKVA